VTSKCPLLSVYLSKTVFIGDIVSLQIPVKHVLNSIRSVWLVNTGYSQIFHIVYIKKRSYKTQLTINHTLIIEHRYKEQR